MKWFVYAATPIMVVPAVDRLPDAVNGMWLALVLIATATAIEIAIPRHRLYDKDAIINRALLYFPVTAMMALIYIGGVAGMQAVFRAMTGQEQQPQFAAVVSTLAIAALFNPLRRRIQSFIDRRFYSHKSSRSGSCLSVREKASRIFAASSINNDLVGVVRETMQPVHVSLWLRLDTTPERQQPG